VPSLRDKQDKFVQPQLPAKILGNAVRHRSFQRLSILHHSNAPLPRLVLLIDLKSKTSLYVRAQ
jgi:hypothetical protein